MIDFFYQYGLFTAKIFTVALILLGVLVVLLMLFGQRDRRRDYIEIEKLNDKFDLTRETLEEELLTKEE